MILAQAVELGFDLAQFGGFALEAGFGFDNLVGVAGLRCAGFALFGECPQVFVELQFLMEFVVLRRNFCLPRQFLNLFIELSTNIVNAAQIFLRVLKARFGFATPFPIFGDPCYLLEEYPQLFRF